LAGAEPESGFEALMVGLGWVLIGKGGGRRGGKWYFFLAFVVFL